MSAPTIAGSRDNSLTPERQALFISHANPEDNMFTLWLAAKLAAVGYEVWADVLRLRGGQDWQRLLERALRQKASKVLLVGTPAGVEKQGVRNELQIAHEVAKQIGDTEFILPLRLAPFESPFLVAHAQYIDFSSSWFQGLAELLDTLENTYSVPRLSGQTDTNWQALQTLHATSLQPIGETLTSNWAAITSLPRNVRYSEFSPLAPTEDLDFRLKTSPVPVIKFANGALSFASAEELGEHFGRGALRHRFDKGLHAYVGEGWDALGVGRHVARTHFSELTRQGLEQFFHRRGLSGYELSGGRFGWWAPADLAPAGKIAFRWGSVAGLRKIRGSSPKRGFHWHFGVTANARTWPTPHVRFTNRLIFSEDGTTPIGDSHRMHRLRRSFGKNWRNARWRDMLLAFLFWLAEGRTELAVPLAAEQSMILRLPPLGFIAPVSIPQELDSETDHDEALDEEAEDGLPPWWEDDESEEDI